MVATGKTIGLAEWIIDDKSLVYFYFLTSPLASPLILRPGHEPHLPHPNYAPRMEY